MMPLQEGVRKSTLWCQYFEKLANWRISFSYKRKGSSLENISLSKSKTSNHQTTPVLKDNSYAAATGVGTNDLFSSVKSISKICKD